MSLRASLLAAAMFLTAAVATPARAQAPTSGLMGLYTFNARSIADSSGLNRNGVRIGKPTYTFGLYGTDFALTMDGASGAKLPKSASLGLKELSVSIWFNPAPTQAQLYNSLFYRANQVVDVASGIGWRDRSLAAFWRADNGLHVVYTPNGADSQYICLNGALPNGPALQAGVWTHLGIVVSGKAKSVTVYVNGAPAQTCPLAAGKLADGYAALLLGQTFNGQESDTRNFSGRLDQVRFYGAALKPADMAAIYAARQ